MGFLGTAVVLAGEGGVVEVKSGESGNSLTGGFLKERIRCCSIVYLVIFMSSWKADNAFLAIVSPRSRYGSFVVLWGTLSVKTQKRV